MVHPWDLTNIFQPFVQEGSFTYCGAYYETRSEAEKAAELWALKWESEPAVAAQTRHRGNR